NAERILATLESLLPALLDREERPSLGNGVGYLITARMAELFAVNGDAVAGVDRVFDRLERVARNRDAVRLLRAEFHLHPRSIAGMSRPPARDPRGIIEMESLADTGSGFFKRRALASAATIRFVDGEYRPARMLYAKYVDEYPTSDYPWVAALRIGQCEALLGDTQTAITSFEQAAARFAANPLARTLGHAFAASSAEAAAQFARARDDYGMALSAWDADYGEKYSLGVLR